METTDDEHAAAGGGGGGGSEPAAVGSGAALERPKRSLSAFNLYYRYKRSMVLDAIDLDPSLSADEIKHIVEASPGLEDCLDLDVQGCGPRSVSPPAHLDELRRRRNAIRRYLEPNPHPCEAKSQCDGSAINGALSFAKLGNLIKHCWDGCDKFAKGVFQELSEEGRGLCKTRLEEYNTKDRAQARATKKANSKTHDNGKDKATKKRVNGDAKASARKLPPVVAGPGMQNLISRKGYRSLSPPRIIPSSKQGSQSSPSPIHNPPSSSDEANLKSRVRELQDQVENAKLRARVAELENELVTQRKIEAGLRAHIHSLTNNGASGPVFPTTPGVMAPGQPQAMPPVQQGMYGSVMHGLVMPPPMMPVPMMHGPVPPAPMPFPVGGMMPPPPGVGLWPFAPPAGAMFPPMPPQVGPTAPTCAGPVADAAAAMMKAIETAEPDGSEIISRMARDAAPTTISAGSNDVDGALAVAGKRMRYE